MTGLGILEVMGLRYMLTGGRYVARQTRRVTTSATSTATGPFRRMFMREVERAQNNSKRPLTTDEAWLVAAAAFTVVLLALMSEFMRFAKYSTLSVEEISAYHIWVPVVLMASKVLYIIALWVKGVDYWLAYAPAVILIGSASVFLGLVYGHIEPSSLEAFDLGWAWWRGE